MSKIVIAKCVSCSKKREIQAGDIPAGEHPICDECYMPMTAELALNQQDDE